MENVCRCNKCWTLFIDTNPQINAKTFDISKLNLATLVDHNCPNCKTDGYLMDVETLEL